MMPVAVDNHTIIDGPVDHAAYPSPCEGMRQVEGPICHAPQTVPTANGGPEWLRQQLTPQHALDARLIRF